MADDLLHQPLGKGTPAPPRLGLRFWSAALLLALVATGTGALAWRHRAAPDEPRGMVAVIKPAEAPQPPKPAAAPLGDATATPAQGNPGALHPPGTTAGMGLFIKVPQDNDDASHETSRVAPGSRSK